MSETAVAELAIDPARLARAVHLDAEEVEAGRWSVTGGSSSHVVTVAESGPSECDCGDFVYRQRLCKHVLRVQLARLDQDVIAALRMIVENVE